MAGTLHIATDTQFLDDVQRSVGETLLDSEAPHILVYQTHSGRTGFDADSDGEALAYSLLANAHICSPSGEITSFSDARKSFEIDVLSFLSKGGPNPVVVVGSSSEMQEALAEFTEYSARLRRNELLARYGKSETELTVPTLSKLFATDRNAYFEALEMLYQICSRVMVWSSYGGGFGMHVISIAQDHAQYHNEIIERWAQAHHCKVSLISRETIPAW